MNIAIIGCGNIGTKRAHALSSFPEDKIVEIVETDRSRWPTLEKTFKVPVSEDFQKIIESKNVDAVIISTPPWNHISLIRECLKNNKDVLCEKPIGVYLGEVKEVTSLANTKKKILKCGFNLCHDLGLSRVKSLLEDGVIGAPYFFKCTYVNGCVLVNTNRVGALMDMGSHILDLVRWFLGDPKEFKGYLQQAEFPLDDNGFLGFKINNIIGQIHFSFIRWQNQFQLEISGEKGAIEVSNLPKWGRQEVKLHRRVYPAGTPEITIETFDQDKSWEREWITFRELVKERNLTLNNQALKVMELTDFIQRTIQIERINL